MSFSLELIERLDTVEPELRAVLWAILREIERHREETTADRSASQVDDALAATA